MCPFGPWPSRCVADTDDVEHPKTVGDRTTLAIMAALHDVGYDVPMPFGENTRYDLVIDDGRELKRVQCKTGRLYGGAESMHSPSTVGRLAVFTSYQSTMSRIGARAPCASTHRETISVQGFGWRLITKLQPLP
jgi:hypothetical protein